MPDIEDDSGFNAYLKVMLDRAAIYIRARKPEKALALIGAVAVMRMADEVASDKAEIGSLVHMVSTVDDEFIRQRCEEDPETAKKLFGMDNMDIPAMVRRAKADLCSTFIDAATYIINLEADHTDDPTNSLRL